MSTAPNKRLAKIERWAAHWQGKGWGTATVDKEFAIAQSLLNDRGNAHLFVDIGGNKGAYTDEIIRNYPDAQVVIFEPSRINAEALKKKFSHKKSVHVAPLAASGSGGAATLFSNEEGSVLGSLTKRRLDHFDIAFEQTEEVQKVRFEEYWINELNRQVISLCKIDIEGHEFDALTGFGEAINHIDVIQFEFGGTNIDTHTYFQDFWYFFRDNEFELFRISPLGAVKIPRYQEAEEFFITTNYLAKRRA